jgi:hypothetical protein
MSRKQGLHLPDCQAVANGFRKPCDCGQPRHPLPPSQELVIDSRGRWVVQARSNRSDVARSNRVRSRNRSGRRSHYLSGRRIRKLKKEG